MGACVACRNDEECRYGCGQRNEAGTTICTCCKKRQFPVCMVCGTAVQARNRNMNCKKCGTPCSPYPIIPLYPATPVVYNMPPIQQTLRISVTSPGIRDGDILLTNPDHGPYLDADQGSNVNAVKYAMAAKPSWNQMTSRDAKQKPWVEGHQALSAQNSQQNSMQMMQNSSVPAVKPMSFFQMHSEQQIREIFKKYENYIFTKALVMILKNGNCTPCVKASEKVNWLLNNEILHPNDEIRLLPDPKDITSYKGSFPIIFIGGSLIGGWDQFKELSPVSINRMVQSFKAGRA